MAMNTIIAPIIASAFACGYLGGCVPNPPTIPTESTAAATTNCMVADGDGPSCFEAGLIFGRSGDSALALKYYVAGCERNYAPACERLTQIVAPDLDACRRGTLDACTRFALYAPPDHPANLEVMERICANDGDRCRSAVGHVGSRDPTNAGAVASRRCMRFPGECLALAQVVRFRQDKVAILRAGCHAAIAESCGRFALALVATNDPREAEEADAASERACLASGTSPACAFRAVRQNAVAERRALAASCRAKEPGACEALGRAVVVP